jgi:protein-tyrosine phosphatase
MYDIHCHLLPEIDDGSPSMEYSLDMASFAVKHGTTHMVVTPHIHPGRYDNEKQSITHAYQVFRKALSDAGIPLALGMAAEVRLSPEIMVLFQHQKIPFLGETNGSTVLLLELPHDQVPLGSENLVDWLGERSCRAMIAHPERNKGIMRKPELLNPFLKRGCLVQVTAGSLVGKFGERARSVAIQLLLDGNVDVIASDSHNLTHRTPDLSAGFQCARDLVGAAAAKKLVIDNPKKITASQFN